MREREGVGPGCHSLCGSFRESEKNTSGETAGAGENDEQASGAWLSVREGEKGGAECFSDSAG